MDVIYDLFLHMQLYPLTRAQALTSRLSFGKYYHLFGKDHPFRLCGKDQAFRLFGKDQPSRFFSPFIGLPPPPNSSL